MPVYQNVGVTYATNVVTTGNSEQLVLDSGRVAVVLPTMRAVVTALASVQLSASNTGLTARIRRGSGLAATQAQISTINTTSSWQQDLSIGFSEQVLNQEFVEYTFTVQTTAGAANATVIWAVLRIDLING